MYSQCSRCANTTIIAFQDENGFVQIGNLTSAGWILTQLGSALDPAMGTGLALQPFYFSGREDQINVYHQKSNLNMTLACWSPAPNINGGSSNSFPSMSIYPADGLLACLLTSQAPAGPSTNKSTTPSHSAPPSPPPPLILTSPLASKLGSRLYPSPTEALKSILGPEPSTIGWSSTTILRPW